MKKLLNVFLALIVLSMVLAGCQRNTSPSGSQGSAARTLVGISMPTQSSERWIKDGNTLRDILISSGYDVELQYAEDRIPTQLLQIEAMITRGAKVLVISAIDASTLSGVLTEAARNGVAIIAYDRLLVDTDAVSYYATFDNFGVGVLQAQSLVDGMRAKRGSPPYRVELFAGSPDDTNSFYFYSGAMSILQPLIDRGEIVVPSGQTAQAQIGTLRWDGAVAQARMDAILAAHYSGNQPLHGVLSPYDGLSRGIISALVSHGFRPNSPDWPIVTGQDAEAASISLIRSGEQYSTVLKDTRDLAAVAANMVVAILEGRTPEINDTTTYHNNVKVVPSYLLIPYDVTVENYRRLVIDSGYLSESEIP